MKSNEDVNHQDEVIEVPKLRFIPFNKPWGKSKLKDIATFINGRAYKQNELLDSGKYRVLRVGNFFTNTSWYFSDLELNHKYYAEEGDLLYTWSASFGPHIWHGEKLIYHYHIWKIELSGKTDKLFAKYLLDYDKEKILSDKNGSTMVHITKKGMEEKEVNLPSYSEQIKIGVFLKNLDNVISLHQQELDAFKQIKQGFLQKMFPKEGQSRPEIRFKEFFSPWREYKLSDLSKVTTGKAFKSTDFNSDGEYLVVTNKNIQDEENEINSKGDRINISDQVILDKYLLNGKNILVTMDGVNIGKTGRYSNNKAVLAQRVGRINSDQFEFIYQVTKSPKFISKMNQISVGNAIKHISLQQIADYSFMAPTEIAERVKIGEFFKDIDELILLAEKKIKGLQSTKKGFLQKMFV